MPVAVFLGVTTVAAALALGLPALAQTAGGLRRFHRRSRLDDPAKIGSSILQLRVPALQRTFIHWFPPGRLAGRVSSSKRVPITFGRAAWANLAKLYYALEATGDLARLDGEVFQTVHNDRLNLFEERRSSNGSPGRAVDQKKFTEAFNSFGVENGKVNARPVGAGLQDPGVPALALLTASTWSAAAGFNEVLAGTDKLIAKRAAEARQERSWR